MAKIRANELFEKEDIFQGIRESAEKTMVTLDKIDEEFKKIGATLKNDISKAKFGGAKELKEFMQMVEKANNLQRDTIKLEKEKAIAEQQSEKLKQQKIRTQTAENRQQERINKQKQKAVKLAKDEKDAYKQLVKATRDLKNESKTLGAEMLSLEASGRKNTEQYRKLSRQYKQVTASAKQGDAQLKKLDKTVGDNFRNVGNYRGAISKLRNGLAQLGLAFGLSQVVRSSMNTIVDYGTANSKLASILGTTTDKTKQLQKVQRELGASTSFTAGEVAELQTELAKIGFSQQDIADSTEGILLLAKASGTDLANASTIAGATLRGFGLDVKDTSHLADVMAKSFSSSALDIGLFGESMKYVAPVSKSANISLEETTALLSILADNGVKGSQAGTSLKRIISELAKTGKPLEEALKDVADAGIDLVSAQDEVGRSAQTSLLILSDNIEKIDEFSEKYEKADGSARAMADTMDDNLAGSLARLNSKWEDFLLGVNDSSGASEGFRKVLDFLAENLTTIFTIIGKVLRAWIVYKTTMLALKGINFALSGGFKDLGTQIAKQIPLTKAYAREQKALAKNTKMAKTSTSAFGSSLASLGIGLAIGLLVELGLKWYDLASQTAEARRQQDLYNDASAEGQKRAKKISGAFAKQLDEELRVLDLETRKTLALEKNEKKRQQIREDALKEMDRITNKTIAQVDVAIAKGVDDVQKFRANADKNIKIVKQSQGMLDKLVYGQKVKDITNIYNKEIIAQNTVVNELKKQSEGLTKQSEEYKTQLIEETQANRDYNVTRHKTKDANDDASDSQKTFNTTLKNTNDYLSRQIDLQQQLIEIEQERELITAQKDIDAEFERQLKLLEETGKFDANLLNQMIREKTEMEKGFIDQRVQYEMDAVDRKIEQTEKKEMDALINERDRLLSQKDITQDAIDKINADFDKKDDELVVEQTERRKDAETEKLIIHEQGINDKKELNDKELEDIDDYNQQLIDKSKDTNKKILETSDALVKASADYFIKQSNRKIEQLDKEISMAEKQADTLRSLAEQGNIDAKESLAEQEKIISEANRKKIQEQQRQQRIQLAQSVFSTYNSKIQSNSKNPLAETIRDTQVLNQFIQSLPTFESGIDDTGTNGRGIDGKGGFLSVLHPNERVVPKALNEQIGGLTNDELSNLAMEYQNGKIVRSDSQVSSALELAVLVNRLDNLTQVIQDKPETNIALGEITQGAMEIVKSTKKGNTIVYNRYKVK